MICDLAVLRLRAVALAQTGGRSPPPATTGHFARDRPPPPVSDQPMLWRSPRRAWPTSERGGPHLVAVLVIATFVPAVWIAGEYLFD